MPAILRKSSFFFFTHLGTFSIPGLVLIPGWEDPGMISVMALWVPLWISSSILWSERAESYAFLRTLPVTDRQIVRTKFGLALGFISVYWAILALLIGKAWGGRPEFAGYMALASLTCAISIILAAGWYLLSWRCGTLALTVAVIALLAIAVVGTMAANMQRMIKTRGIGILAPRWLAEGPWLLQVLLFAAALAAFAGLMRVAYTVKERSETGL